MAWQGISTELGATGRMVRALGHLLLACVILYVTHLPSWAGDLAAAGKQRGDNAYLVGEYKLPAAIDATVAPEMATELWAVVYRPARAGHYPLLVFLHGNHGTCGYFDAAAGVRHDWAVDYTYDGTCPEGWVPTPNHLGYGYLATELASRGYVVVSINANRGVTSAPGVGGDDGLNLRRGRLVLRHLQQLAAWNAGTARPPASLGFGLRGLIDLDHVGLMGHSRGGEGMRAALAQYRDTGSPWPRRIGRVGFEAVFEIGPVDGQTLRTLDAEGVAWNVLLPGCDGDVADLQGVHPLDRMIMRRAETRALPKSSIEVLGTNHNFYNTEWQESDALECPGQPMLFSLVEPGSSQQRAVARETVVPFFLAHVGNRSQPGLADLLDPSRPLPAALRTLTLFARGQVASLRPADSFIIDDFTGSTGTSSRGATNAVFGLSAYAHGGAGPSHDAAQRAATLAWSSRTAWFQANASDSGLAVPDKDFKSLEFRIKLECHDDLCGGTVDPEGDVDLSLRLVDGNGRLSAPVVLSSMARVYRPVSAYAAYGYSNSVFQTVRVPLKSFAGADLRNFRGVRFSFDRTARGQIGLANIRLVREPADTRGALIASVRAIPSPETRSRDQLVQSADTNRIVAVRRVAGQPGVPGEAPAGKATSPIKAGAEVAVEVELSSSRRFPITDALPTLGIGNQTFRLSRFAPSASDRIIFRLSEAEYQALPNGAPTTVQIGAAPLWHFGPFHKN